MDKQEVENLVNKIVNDCFIDELPVFELERQSLFQNAWNENYAVKEVLEFEGINQAAFPQEELLACIPIIFGTIKTFLEIIKADHGAEVNDDEANHHTGKREQRRRAEHVVREQPAHESDHEDHRRHEQARQQSFGHSRDVLGNGPHRHDDNEGDDRIHARLPRKAIRPGPRTRPLQGIAGVTASQASSNPRTYTLPAPSPWCLQAWQRA